MFPFTPMFPSTPKREQHEMAILAEYERAEQRAIVEVEASAPLTVGHCDHRYLSLRSYTSSPFDDHATARGFCPSCSQWLVVTEYADGRTESSPLAERDLDRFEQRYREERRGSERSELEEGRQ